FFRGMSARETADLTTLMLNSGQVMDLSGIAGPFVDKHSTGGVGDKVSLILAPMVAACGVRVPMMSGRALGHTGGTLDKLETIPGYTTRLDQARFREYLARDGFAMTGQTDAIVPADKKLYSLRDVTATVESIPLITASILSKKVAEGAEALVFDVKCGPGAFMKTVDDARALAKSLVSTGSAMGKRIVALISDMSEPLGCMVGNFLEVEESMDCLNGKGPSDLMELSYRLGGWMLVAGGKAKDLGEGIALCKEAITSGKATKLFFDNVKSQGGDVDALVRMYGTRRSAFARTLVSPADGYISSVDAYKIGLAGVHLGVGRNTVSDPVSAEAGFVFHKRKGQALRKGEPVATVYGKDEASIDAAWPLVQSSLCVGDSAPAAMPLIIEELTAL
ncbi:MAG TPA: thymidine phosphorylase, partial [Spirochaetales bacterium]|nr:thymidine phosphorylase [Spirochaetales bacterium]